MHASSDPGSGTSGGRNTATGYHPRGFQPFERIR